MCLIFSLALHSSYIGTKGDLQISVLLKLLSIKSAHILDFNLPFCLPGFLPHLFGAPWIKVHGGERTESLNNPAASLSSTYPFQILPLPVLKNIMFLSLSGRHSSYTTAFWITSQYFLIKGTRDYHTNEVSQMEKDKYHMLISVHFGRSVISDSLRPHELQQSRTPSPSPTPRACSNSCPLSQWCHPTISSSVVPFSSHLQSFPASGSFQMRKFFTSGGQSIGVSASPSVLQMNIQDWFHLELTSWISLQFKGLSRVFSKTTV